MADTAEVSPFATNQVAVKVTCVATALATHRGGWRRSAPELGGELAKWQ